MILIAQLRLNIHAVCGSKINYKKLFNFLSVNVGKLKLQTDMEFRVGRKYALGRKIGSGSFGDIYMGTNLTTGEDVAIKLEPIRARHPQLIRETKIYRTLHGVGMFIYYL